MSYEFPATDDRIDGTFTTALEAPFTLLAWLYRTDHTTLSGKKGMVSIANARGTTPYAAMITADGADMFQYYHRLNGGTDFITEGSWGAIYDSVWVPVIITCAGNDTDRAIFRDGSTETNTGNATSIDLGTAMNYIVIGEAEGSGSHLSDGYLAEVAMWDKVLSTTEIDQLRTGPGEGPAPNTVAVANCVGYWPLDTDQSTHTNLGSKSGGTLTVQGTATYNEEHPTITAGGTNESILIPTGPLR